MKTEISMFFLTPRGYVRKDTFSVDIPFGYVYVDATSGDGNAHNVQIYSDLTGGTYTLHTSS